MISAFLFAACKYHGSFSVAYMSKKGNSFDGNYAVEILRRIHFVLIYYFDVQDLSTGWLHCDPGPLFKPESFSLPAWVSDI